jgi:hypothetical protein
MSGLRRGFGGRVALLAAPALLAACSSGSSKASSQHVIRMRANQVARFGGVKCAARTEAGAKHLLCEPVHGSKYEAAIYGDQTFVYKNGNPDSPVYVTPAVGQTNRGAAALARRVVMDIDVWHDARTWSEMHPADQRLVSQRQYARCEPGPLLGTEMTGGSRRGAEPITHVTVRVVRVRPRRVSLPGISEHDGKRVYMRWRWRTKDGAAGSGVFAVDVVRDRGEWRWLLDQGTVDQVRAHPHRCWE